MEMSLFKKDGKTWTRFKVSRKEFDKWDAVLELKYCIDSTKPVKESSRYVYFEREDDLINA